MAASAAVPCTGTKVISLAAIDSRTSFATRSFQFRLLSKGILTKKVSWRRRGVSIIRCVEDKSTVTVEGGDGWIAENDGLVRSLPLFLGAGALVAVLFNRSFAGIAPVADSSRFSAKFLEISLVEGFRVSVLAFWSPL